MSEKIDISNMFEFKELTPEECLLLKDALRTYRPFIEFEINSKKIDAVHYTVANEQKKKNQEILNKIDYLLNYL